MQKKPVAEPTSHVAEAVTLQTTTAAALQMMDQADADVLSVLTPDGAGCAGVVLRRALERGCIGMGHDKNECVVLHHLKRDVALVTGEGEAEAWLAQGTSRPVVVIDESGRPLRAILRETDGRR